MASRIAGITVEIGGDTTKLTKALSGVNKSISQTQTALKDVNKLLKLDPGNTELLQQKQKNLASAIEETKAKLTTLKNASEEAAKTAGNYDDWKAKYDPIQTEIKETNEKLKTLKEEAEKADQELSEGKISQEKYDAIQSEVKETEQHLKDLKSQAEAVSEEFGHPISPEKYDALQREIIETEQDLKSLEKEYQNFGTVAGQKLQAVGQKMQELGSKISQVGQKITGFGNNLTAKVTLPLVAIGTAGVTSFAEVDKTMQLANKTMGSTEEEAAALNETMKAAASNSTFGMSDAATATLNFARAGLDAGQAANALAPAMNLAAGEGGNLDTVSAGLVATINGFHGTFSEAEKYADVFAAACNNSALDVDSLSSAMSVAAPIFASAGYSVNDAALYMGVMANNGIEADKAANSLKTGIARLVSPASEGAAMMEKLGISVTNADGSMKDSVVVQQELHDAFSKLSESEQIAAASAIFGKNQMAPWLALINTAPGDVSELNSALLDCSGTTQEMADTMMGGFGGTLEKLKSSIDVLVTSIGQALAPSIQSVVDFIQQLVDKFNALSPAQQETIAKFALVAAAVGPVVSVVGGLVTGVGGAITTIGGLIGNIGSLSTVFSGLSGAGTALAGVFSALTSPIGLVVVAIAAVVAIGVTLYTHWDEIKAWATEKWNAIKEAVSSAVQGMKEKVSQTWENIKSKTSETWENIKSRTSETWSNVKSTVSERVGSIVSTISEKFDSAKTTVSTVFNSIKEEIRSKIEGAREVVRSAIEAIKDFFHFEWSLPPIKLPHFSISGKFSLDPPSIPRISVSWYKKAMDNAMVLDNATIFGMAGGRMLGGGEAGREVVSGEGHLVDLIASTMDEAVGRRMDGVLDLLRQYLPECASTKVAFPLDSIDSGLSGRAARRAAAW